MKDIALHAANRLPNLRVPQQIGPELCKNIIMFGWIEICVSGRF